ncbi:hypothetical protein AWB67_06974 [Caballeronia terrestris]|jgi:hypothetical protein|uniref:Uncharacterized protein n=1 Tax=Caballeronia terrestris TaxID=1226301 RepID=A0A158KYS2_9BURK|nr:hypothetical protein AWB67_06974 [Caballeronia terrestris]
MYSEIRLDDIRRGMEWWESLSEAERSEWFAKVGTTRPADAWDAFKRSRRGGDSMKPAVQPTEELRRGMDWWKSLSEDERTEWFAKLDTHRPKDAWSAFRRSLTKGDEGDQEGR